MNRRGFIAAWLAAPLAFLVKPKPSVLTIKIPPGAVCVICVGGGGGGGTLSKQLSKHLSLAKRLSYHGTTKIGDSVYKNGKLL